VIWRALGAGSVKGGTSVPAAGGPVGAPLTGPDPCASDDQAPPGTTPGRNSVSALCTGGPSPRFLPAVLGHHMPPAGAAHECLILASAQISTYGHRRRRERSDNQTAVGRRLAAVPLQARLDLGDYCMRSSSRRCWHFAPFERTTVSHDRPCPPSLKCLWTNVLAIVDSAQSPFGREGVSGGGLWPSPAARPRPRRIDAALAAAFLVSFSLHQLHPHN
jgi:hypothetical protein